MTFQVTTYTGNSKESKPLSISLLAFGTNMFDIPAIAQ